MSCLQRFGADVAKHADAALAVVEYFVVLERGGLSGVDRCGAAIRKLLKLELAQAGLLGRVVVTVTLAAHALGNTYRLPLREVCRRFF